MASERLQKLMARAGLGSRRACEEIIQQCRVTVNGQLATLGDSADPVSDRVLVDGVPLRFPQAPTVVALYKPMYALSTDAPHKGDTRPTARSFVALETRLFAVGRLDADSEGLMIFTDDGELAHRLTHPRYEHEKEYRVQVAGHPDANVLRRWRSGVQLEDGKTAPAQVDVLRAEKNTTWLKVVMHEGRKRQIRRMAVVLGHRVRKLIRVRIGPIRLGQLKPGQWRLLAEQELKDLQTARRRPARKPSPKPPKR